jgi:hypothetical protein
MAATGFLPGALSFLCALSHLEGVAHRPTSLTQSSTAWSQQPTGKMDTGFPKPVQQSQDDLTVLISEQGLHAQARSAFPGKTKTLPSKLTWTFRSGNAHTGFLSHTDSTALNKGKHAFFSTQHRLPLCIRHTRGLLQTGSYRSTLRAVGSNGMREPPPPPPPPTAYLSVLFACVRVDTCHPGTACVPPARMPPSHHLGIHCPSKRT